MKRESSGQILSAVFVDYDNIYLSLKRKNEEAAKRFAKDAHLWLAEIESGRLIAPTNKLPSNVQRRIVLNRCYGNPVPRRNQNDNSTDMNSFPFVRHHFLRAGFEVIDCPPLTAQLKNSSDIRMVMDVRDYLDHETYFDEFIILSGDADFTPVLHRLRAHARRTVVYANDFTAAPYVAIADGEIREADLIAAILRNSSADNEQSSARDVDPTGELRREIMSEITGAVRSSNTPLPLEALAERATRALGHDRTVGTNWAGAGSFRDLLLQSLPEGIRLSDQPPYVVYDATKQPAPEGGLLGGRGERAERAPGGLGIPTRNARPSAEVGAAALAQALNPVGAARASSAPQPQAQQVARPTGPAAAQTKEAGGEVAAAKPVMRAEGSAQQNRTAESASALQRSIARIHEASQVPPLSPPEYRALFELLAKEINSNSVQGTQTIANVANRARELGLDIRSDDIRFVLDVVGEHDPWFEQGVSANLFAGRFRNFVVARCRSYGLNLTPDEIDLIDAWFTGGGPSPATARQPSQPLGKEPPRSPVDQPSRSLMPTTASEPRSSRWWSREEPSSVQSESSSGRGVVPGSAPKAGTSDEPTSSDDFPRILRTRLRG